VEPGSAEWSGIIGALLAGRLNEPAAPGIPRGALAHGPARFTASPLVRNTDNGTPGRLAAADYQRNRRHSAILIDGGSYAHVRPEFPGGRLGGERIGYRSSDTLAGSLNGMSNWRRPHRTRLIPNPRTSEPLA